jgi:tetratricopeptide (TPR) repeat protein
MQKCLFLKNHALFLVSEQAKDEEILETGGSSDKIISSPVIN